jgi:hypothetical protein
LLHLLALDVPARVGDRPALRLTLRCAKGEVTFGP